MKGSRFMGCAIGLMMLACSARASLAQTADEKASEITRVSALVPGRVIEVTAKQGELIEKGQLLIRLDDIDYKLDLEEAEIAIHIAQAELNAREAALDLAQNEFKRAEMLFKTGTAVTEGEVLRLRFELRSAETGVVIGKASLDAAKVKAIRANLMRSRCEITAPHDGKVKALHLGIGEFAKKGQVVVELESVED